MHKWKSFLSKSALLVTGISYTRTVATDLINESSRM